MTTRHLVALGIADALIAGPRDAASARLRCERTLSSRARWIGRLAQKMIALFSENWRDTARHDMAHAIEQSQAFDRAWRAPLPPRLRSLPVTPPRMAPLPRALLDCVVPDLPTPRDLARWLDLSLDELAWLTGPLERPVHDDQRTTHYNYRWLPKRTGGVRLLEIPKAQLCAIQRRLLHRLLEYVPPHEAAHGFRERHSCVTNARPHIAQKVVLRMDLADFFGSIGGGKVCALFTTLGYPVAAARALTRLTTSATPQYAWSAEHMRGIEGGPHAIDWHARKRLAAPHLPQGAPTSPALANLCAFNFDVRVQALADKFEVQYTRYADDLTFSGSDALAPLAHLRGTRSRHRARRRLPSQPSQNPRDARRHPPERYRHRSQPHAESPARTLRSPQSRTAQLPAPRRRHAMHPKLIRIQESSRRPHRPSRRNTPRARCPLEADV